MVLIHAVLREKLIAEREEVGEGIIRLRIRILLNPVPQQTPLTLPDVPGTPSFSPQVLEWEQPTERIFQYIVICIIVGEPLRTVIMMEYLIRHGNLPSQLSFAGTT